jgi:hypothetical protein
MLLLLPNDRAMIRIHKLGVIDYLVKASKEKAASIKIICPLSETNSSIVKRITDDAPDIKVLNGTISQHRIYIVDGIKFLRIKLVRRGAESVSEAVGFAFYPIMKGVYGDHAYILVNQLWLMTIENTEEISAVEYGQTRNHEKMVYKVTNQEARNLGEVVKE